MNKFILNLNLLKINKKCYIILKIYARLKKKVFNFILIILNTSLINYIEN